MTNSAPYFDELHDYFELEVDEYASKMIDKVENMRTLSLLTQAIVAGTYRPEDATDFFDRLSTKYLTLQR